jgi:hypothetical protein
MHAHHHNPDTKPRDLRRFKPTGRPYCPICGARSGQSHDTQAHAAPFALVSCHRCPGPPATPRRDAVLLPYHVAASWRRDFGEPAHLWHCPSHAVDCPTCDPALEADCPYR